MKTKRGQIHLQNFAESLRRNQSLILMYIVMIVFAAPFVHPFWWMISSSFKPFEEIFAYPPRLLPQTWVIENYQHVFDMQPLRGSSPIVFTLRRV
jgi:ABC-type glycerol-3-phosphate transport system permease component